MPHTAVMQTKSKPVGKRWVSSASPCMHRYVSLYS